MNSPDLHALIDQLPAALQKEVYDFAAFLLDKRGKALRKEPRITMQGQALVSDKTQRGSAPLLDKLEAIAEHCASLPVRDDRPADAILGYDERGMPG